MANTVETTHPTYPTGLDDWKTCRDVFGGAKAVKAAGPRYLPRLSGQNDEEYKAYVARANLYNVFKRTVNGLTGTVFERQPSIECPESIKPHLADVTLAGEPFEVVARAIVAEVLKVGRHGSLIDYADASKRPYWTLYEAEAICDWDTEQRAGDTVLTWLVLKECVSERNGFERKKIDQYRTLELTKDEDGASGTCLVKIWRKSTEQTAADKWVVHKEIVPVRLGAPLTFIPFVCFNPMGIGLDVQSPPLKDLADVNLSHYRNSADHENGLHFTGVPTLFVKGIPATDTIRIGSAEAIVATSDAADAKFVEFTGEGLKPVTEAMDRKEAQMTVLGSRLLETQKTAQEAAATVRMRHAGDNATLQDIVGTVSLGLTVAFRMHAFWANASDRIDDDAISVTLNTDFIAQIQDINTLMLMRQGNLISQRTFYWNLERAGLTRPGIDVEQENEDIKAEGGGDELDDDDLPAPPKKPAREPENANG